MPDPRPLLPPSPASRIDVIRQWLVGTFIGRAFLVGASVKLVAFLLCAWLPTLSAQEKVAPEETEEKSRDPQDSGPRKLKLENWGVALDFAKDCGYISEEEHQQLVTACAEVGRMLGAMLQNPDPFLLNLNSEF